MSGGSSLQAGGGLDVGELSQKLATLPVQDEAGNEMSEVSSTAAVFGSETTDGERKHTLPHNTIKNSSKYVLASSNTVVVLC